MSIHPAEAQQHFGQRSDSSHGRFESPDRCQNVESPFAREYLNLQRNGNAVNPGHSFSAVEALQNRGLLPGLQLTDCNSRSDTSFAPSNASRQDSFGNRFSGRSAGDGLRQQGHASPSNARDSGGAPAGASQGRAREINGAGDGANRTERTPTNSSGSPSRSELSGNEQRIMDYFMGKGLTRAQAAGIVGNIHQESGGDPNRRQMGGGPGYGLAQWEGSRKRDLAQFAREQGRPISDLRTQLDFMYKELTSTESRAFRALETATTSAQAADIFQRQYERAARPNTNNRIAHANRVFRSYGDNQTMIAER